MRKAIYGYGRLQKSSSVQTEMRKNLLENIFYQTFKLKYSFIAEVLRETTAGTLIMKEVPGVTPQTLRPAGNTAMCPLVEIKLDLVCITWLTLQYITSLIN